MTKELRKLLEKIEHTLTAENGLEATERIEAYYEAQERGCDQNAAWDEVRGLMFTIDHESLLAEIRKVLEGKSNG